MKYYKITYKGIMVAILQAKNGVKVKERVFDSAYYTVPKDSLKYRSIGDIKFKYYWKVKI